MGLPKIDQPIFDYTLPISQIDIKFRPFLVKEEKLLLIGKEADVKQQLNAMKQVIKNVIIEPSDLVVDDLTSTDVEMLFIQLRSRSVQNVVELQYRDTEDKEIYKFNVNLDELEPTIDPNHKNEIQLDDQYTLILKDPTLGMMTKIGIGMNDGEPSTEDIFKLVAGCLVSVYDKDEVYDDFNMKEALEFVKSFDVKRFEKLKEFFDTLPKLTYDLNYKNKLDNERKIVLNGLADFF
jgi:hypothetical protein